MKILQVISSFPPAYAYGGALKSAYEISKQLVEDGHSVTVYTTDVYDSNSRLEFEENPIWMDGIEVYHFKNISNRLSYKNFPIAPDMAFALKKNINKFDIVHLHEYRSFQAILVHHYSEKNKVPYIVQPHGSVVNIMGMFWFKELFDKTVGSPLLKDSSKVIALTNVEKNILKKLGIKDGSIEILPNGINLLDYENLPEKGIFKKKYGVHHNEKLILFLGRLHKIKGIELLINSFAELPKAYKDVKLIIAGPDGGCLSEIKELILRLNIKNKVIITGPLYNEEKFEALIDADVYVLPSVYETFPNTVIESCACKTPVILTDRCGISDLIKHNVGYVVQYEKNSLKEALISILDNDQLRETFSKNCSKFVQVNFNLENTIKQFEEIYENLV